MTRTLLVLSLALFTVGCSNAGTGDTGDLTSPQDSGEAHDTSNDSASRAGPEVVLNEFMAKNESTLADASGKFEDWIELYNRGDETADLSDWTLSDDNDVPWNFPDDTELAAGAHLLIWADEDIDETDGLHASLKLGTDGDRIVLTPPEGEPLTWAWGTSREATEPGADEVQEADVSYGRLVDGEEPWGPMTNPTPGSANEG